MEKNIEGTTPRSTGIGHLGLMRDSLMAQQARLELVIRPKTATVIPTTTSTP